MYVKITKVKFFIEDSPELLEAAINKWLSDHSAFKVISLAVAFEWTASLAYETFEEVKDVSGK